MDLTKNARVESYDDKYLDPRPSLWRWRASADSSHIETNSIAPPDSENERVSCCHRKPFCSKAKNVGLHVTCTRELTYAIS